MPPDPFRIDFLLLNGDRTRSRIAAWQFQRERWNRHGKGGGNQCQKNRRRIDGAKLFEFMRVLVIQTSSGIR